MEEWANRISSQAFQKEEEEEGTETGDTRGHSRSPQFPKVISCLGSGALTLTPEKWLC